MHEMSSILWILLCLWDSLQLKNRAKHFMRHSKASNSQLGRKPKSFAEIVYGNDNIGVDESDSSGSDEYNWWMFQTQSNMIKKLHKKNKEISRELGARTLEVKDLNEKFSSFCSSPVFQGM